MAKELKNGNNERKTDAMLLSMAKSIVKAINSAPDTNNRAFVERLYSALKAASNENKQTMFVDYLKQVLKETGSINEAKIYESNDYLKIDDSDELESYIKKVLKGNSKPLYIVTDNQAKVRRLIKSVSGSDYTEINCSKYSDKDDFLRPSSMSSKLEQKFTVDIEDKDVVIFYNAEDLSKSGISFMLNAADGRINDKKINSPVIVISSETISGAPIKQRFVVVGFED